MQWVRFAKEPLKLDELRYALAVEANPTSSSIQDCLHLADCETNEELERRMRDLSRGLLEVVSLELNYYSYRSSVDKPRVVQFIHQSVADFILDEGFQILGQSLDSAQSVAS
jgi:hypothetical protein